jgi:manganese transport protein
MAIVPAIICIISYGEMGVTNLLLLSQVVLSFQLAFAVVPLVMFTSDRQKMGDLVNSRMLSGCAWLCATIIVGLNIVYLINFVKG